MKQEEQDFYRKFEHERAIRNFNFMEQKCKKCSQSTGLIIYRGIDEVQCVYCGWKNNLNGLERAKLRAYEKESMG